MLINNLSLIADLNTDKDQANSFYIKTSSKDYVGMEFKDGKYYYKAMYADREESLLNKASAELPAPNIIHSAINDQLTLANTRADAGKALYQTLSQEKKLARSSSPIAARPTKDLIGGALIPYSEAKDGINTYHIYETGAISQIKDKKPVFCRGDDHTKALENITAARSRSTPATATLSRSSSALLSVGTVNAQGTSPSR